MKFEKHPLVALSLCLVLWGLAVAAARVTLREWPPWQSLNLRMFTCTLFLLPFAWKELRAQWHNIPWLRMHLLSFLGNTSFFVLSYICYSSVSGVVASVLQGTGPFFTLLLARWLLKDTLSKWHIISFGLGFAGTAFMAWGGGSAHEGSDLEGVSRQAQLLGFGGLLIANFLWSAYIVVHKSPRGEEALSPRLYTTLLFFCTWVQIWPLLFWEWHTSGLFNPLTVSLKANLLQMFLTLGPSLLAYLCWDIANTKLPAPLLGLSLNALPFLGGLSCLALLGERLSPMEWAGGGVILLGILATERTRPRNIPPSVPEAG